MTEGRRSRWRRLADGGHVGLGRGSARRWAAVRVCRWTTGRDGRTSCKSLGGKMPVGSFRLAFVLGRLTNSSSLRATRRLRRRFCATRHFAPRCWRCWRCVACVSSRYFPRVACAISTGAAERYRECGSRLKALTQRRFHDPMVVKRSTPRRCAASIGYLRRHWSCFAASASWQTTRRAEPPACYVLIPVPHAIALRSSCMYASDSQVVRSVVGVMPEGSTVASTMDWMLLAGEWQCPRAM